MMLPRRLRRKTMKISVVLTDGAMEEISGDTRLLVLLFLQRGLECFYIEEGYWGIFLIMRIRLFNGFQNGIRSVWLYIC